MPSMTVAANMFLGREPKNVAGLVDRRALLRQAREYLAKHGLPLAPRGWSARCRSPTAS